ncbi:MAG: diacylglycerol/lipid kinase family protein, partial [Sinimarinibacterium flocculans]|uniref:diacylglycerol/lipid kinase family protein n=1 Tax=Sinimarinibacterium flocculans TaxID=985250 RepID=UPI003C42D10E
MGLAEQAQARFERRTLQCQCAVVLAEAAIDIGQVAGGAQRLVVLGGDGMVHLAVQAVAGTDTILGVVPVGTGNDFVRALPGIPEGPLEA